MSNSAAVTADLHLVPRTPREPLWRHLVGERFRSIRHERGETLGEVARRAGLSPQYLSEIERGRKEPSSEIIQAIGGALELRLVDLTLGIAERLRESGAAAARASSPTAAFALAA